MTPIKPSTETNPDLLEQILAMVRTLDDRVEEILDRLVGHIEDMEARHDWRDHGYDLSDNHSYTA